MFFSPHDRSLAPMPHGLAGLGGLFLGVVAALALPQPALAGDPAAPEVPGAQAEPRPDLIVADVPYRRIERRANTFTRSSQEMASLGQDASGASVVVWQSRRQEEGTYGIYARRFDADGQPLGGEVHVNSTTASMQMLPVVAVADAGPAWFAWRSFGQDGEQGSIVARRFDAQLSTATPEILVNEETAGDQTDVALGGLPGGGALVVWTSHDPDRGRMEIRARRLEADGTAGGAEVRIDASDKTSAHLPGVAVADDGSAVILWARTDLRGVPAGVFGRRMSPSGALDGAPFRVDGSEKHAIEPVVAMEPAGARFVVGWLESEGEDYGIRLRAFEREEGDWRGGKTRPVAVSGPGYTSGLALDLDAQGTALVSWNRFGDGERSEPGVFAQLVDRDGKAKTEVFRVTAHPEGPQRIAQACSSRRALLDADGRMAFAWAGDAGLGDSSGAHLTLLTPSELAGNPRETKLDADPVRFEGLEVAAEPHEPPTFDPLRVDRERIDDGPPTSFTGTDFDFLGITSTGWTPPDPHLASGPSHVVAMTNGAIAFFDHNGNLLFQDQIEGSGGFWGAQGATGFVFDPEVIFDPHSNRFMAMANERASNGNPYFLLAVSDDDNPLGTWFKYRINVIAEAGDDDIDSPNIGVSEDVIFLTADFFGPDKFLLYMIEKAPLLSGGTVNATSTVITGIDRQSMGTPIDFDTGTPVLYLINANAGTSTTVRIYAVTDPLTNPQTQFTSVVVPQYDPPQDPPQMGTSVRPETFEARFWSAVYRNGSLWATHHVHSNRVRQRWYQFDMNGWPGGGTPTLVQDGEVNLGVPIRTYFGSIAVDENDNMALVYARSSGTEFISMERTWRAATDPLGTTRTPVSVRTSTSGDNSGRWGDYSSIVDDPVDPNTFWAIHEYRTTDWRTRIARFEIDAGCGSMTRYCSPAVPNSTGSGGVMEVSGSLVVSDDDLVLSATSLPTGSNIGYFIMGTGTNTFVPPGSAGPICVTPGLLRYLPPVSNTNELPGGFSRSVGTSGPVSGNITPGSTWNFQAWHRDSAAGTSNLTDALSVEFCP